MITTDNVQYGWLDRVFEEENNYTAFAISPSNPDILISAGTYVRKTSDAAGTWAQTYTDNVGGGAWKGRGMELMIVQDIAFDISDPDILYVSYDDYGIFRSDDAGNSYVRLDPKLGPYHEEGHDAAGSIVVDPVNGEVYLGRNNGDTVDWGEGFTIGKVWKSSDKGVTWTEITNGLPVGRPELVMDKTSPTDARVLYCAIYNNGVYKTTNSGASWTAVNNGLGSDGNYAYKLVMDPSDSQTLYLGLNTIDGLGGGIYRTTDGGANWVKLTGFGTYDVLDIAVDPNNPQTVYAGAVDSYDWTLDGGLYKSADGGTSWTRIFDQPRVRRILVHPNDSNMLFASSSSWYQVFPNAVTGFYRSTDGGNSWMHISEGLGHNYIYDAEFNPHNLNQIYIGTHGGGLWLLDNVTTSVDEEDRAIPGVFKLSQNYPNPFNPTTKIDFALPRTGNTRLIIYDLRGRVVARLLNGQMEAGYHSLNWNASESASGIYFYRLTSSGFAQTRKMLLMK